MKDYVLDANALYRFLTDGPGAETVERLLNDANSQGARLRMSAVNWGEVYYAVARRGGYQEAQEAGRLVEDLPILIVDADKTHAEAAGRIKAGYGLAYADCYAANLTGKTGVLVTSDVQDFKKVPWLKTLALPTGKPS